jgi:hypothetical protein
MFWVAAVLEPLGSATRDLICKTDLREIRHGEVDRTGIGHGWFYMEINF